MCKIMAIAGIDKDKREATWKFAKAILPYMTIEDNDAVGYAAHDKDGNLFGERWLNTNLALKISPIYTSSYEDVVHETKGIIKLATQYNSFGNLNKSKVKSLILHSRYATCDKGIENAHPFVSEDGMTALVHNGVVQTRGLKFHTSTCDSEGILNEYTENKVYDNFNNIKEVSNKIKGSYACAVLGVDSQDKGYMDLFRNDEYPTLYTCFIKELGTFVYSTEANMIEQAIYNLGWSMNQMLAIEDNSFLRINSDTGIVEEVLDIKPERKVTRFAAKRKLNK